MITVGKKDLKGRDISTLRALWKFCVFASVVLDGQRSLDCERSIAGDRPTETKEDLRTQVSLRVTQLKETSCVEWNIVLKQIYWKWQS
jgi:hypothetical protein